MGEASDIVKGNGKSSSVVPRSQKFARGSVAADLTNILDRLDRAKEVKQDDLDQEGRSAQAENHAKLGLLQAAGALVRRARAILEDYGGDLDEDVEAELNEGLGDDLKRKFTDIEDEVQQLDEGDVGLHMAPRNEGKSQLPPEEEEEGSPNPFGPEDLPDWLTVGTQLRDSDDDDGPWEVTDIDFDLGRVMVVDRRVNQDGGLFTGGTPQDYIMFDDLAPDGDWCPYDCGHPTTDKYGNCLKCGLRGARAPIPPDLGTKWKDPLHVDEVWRVQDVIGDGKTAKVEMVLFSDRVLLQIVPIREFVDDWEQIPDEDDDIPPGPPSPPRPPKNKPVG